MPFERRCMAANVVDEARDVRVANGRGWAEAAPVPGQRSSERQRERLMMEKMTWMGVFVVNDGDFGGWCYGRWEFG